MTANSNKSKQGNKAAHRVIAGVLCGASVLSLVLSLVMPPISQAIANDAQAAPTEKTVMGGGSSSESTDVDNTTNRDTDNQNSGETEGDETSDSAAEPNPLSDGTEVENTEQSADDGVDDDNAIALSANGEYVELNSSNINKVLQQENRAGKYCLTEDITYDGMVTLGLGETVIDLYGHKILHSGVENNNNSNLPMFNVPNGATLTILDSKQADDTKSEQTAEQGMLATVERNDDGMPLKLTYYVTESSVDTTDSTRTNETTYKHEVAIKGAIVGTTADSTMKLINVYAGGTFNLQSGVLTTTQNAKVGHLIYAENGSTVNISGGYVCGATSMSHGAGIELGIMDGKGATLNLTGGVIAGNYAPNGGGVYANGSTIKMTSGTIAGKKTSGTISGNGTFEDKAGYGAGICALGSTVTISDGYITNNKYQFYRDQESNWKHIGYGCHGGGGIAAYEGAQVTISGGQITGNYSEEAGGGVYVTDVNRSDSQTSHDGMAKLNITGGIIAANVTKNSEGAGVRVGQMVDATINGAKDIHVYITNNHCMSRYDWGGGGIFVQGESTAGNEYRAGKLFVYNSYISSNEAGGYGGGVAVCPTGKTLLTNNDGTAIFGNKSAGNEQSYKGYDDGNDGTPHLSGGGHGKNQDIKAYNSEKFRDNGHADFFLAAEGHTAPIAAVTGKMLGGGDAQYSGSKELTEDITIPANGGVQVLNSIGLSSRVKAGDPAATAAQNAATTFITGNYSWNHGGGIMSNGNLYLGTPADTYVYPSLKLKATKQLVDSSSKNKLPLSEGQFSFTVYRKDSTTATKPFWNQGKFNDGGCTKVATVSNNEDGAIAFNLGEQYAAGGEDNRVVYYLVEDGGSVSDVKCDQAVYEIDVTTKDTVTPLIDGFKIHSCAIQSVKVTKHASDGTSSEVGSTYSNGECEITANGASTFTNVSTTKYDSKGSWTPKVTKVVEGGEMKEFTLEFADNEKFEGGSVRTVTTDATGDTTQTLPFLNASGEGIKYSLSDITKEPYTHGDSTGRGASKTFTYYVCEKNESSIYPHYKFDKSVYKLNVTMTDQKDGTIAATKVTYRKGTVDSDGKWKDAESADHDLTDASIPTFTNTYSTSLPLSGMSGVTLTYLAGAAVLCAAAAWMHIRRKANAKGGKRRE